MVPTSTLSARKAKEIQASINRRPDLWEKRIHAVLAGDVLEEVRSREGRIKQYEEEEEDRLVRSFHSTFLPVKLRQAVCQATNHEGGGVSYPGDVCTNTGQPVAYVLWEKHPDMRVPPVENPT